jgi:hypothetical protein
MKIDPQMLAAFNEGKAAGEAGLGARANPYFYTSDCSDAWAIGERLVATRRILDVKRILGLSRRGLTVEVESGLHRVWHVSYIKCTGSHEVWSGPI